MVIRVALLPDSEGSKGGAVASSTSRGRLYMKGVWPFWRRSTNGTKTRTSCERMSGGTSVSGVDGSANPDRGVMVTVHVPKISSDDYDGYELGGMSDLGLAVHAGDLTAMTFRHARRYLGVDRQEAILGRHKRADQGVRSRHDRHGPIDFAEGADRRSYAQGSSEEVQRNKHVE